MKVQDHHQIKPETQSCQTSVTRRFSSFGIDKFRLKKLISNLSLKEKNLFFRVIITYNSIYKIRDVGLIKDLENYNHLKITPDKKEVISIILKCQKDVILLQLTSLQIIQLKNNKNDIRLHQSKYRQTNGRESTL